jgi:AAA+ ATPase superfamily predicted ATPase
MARQKKKKLENPFVYQGYEGPDYFFDRTEETENIISALRNGRNVTLISPRKIGKTGLIRHVFHQLESAGNDAICIYSDIFATKNLQEFVETIGKAIVEDALQREKTFASKVMDFFKGLRPTSSPDPMTGLPTVTLNVVPVQAELTLKSLFAHLESLDKRVYLAIDEFQQVAYYAEKGAEALLRSHIQFMHNVRFVFSGSKMHMMEEMFLAPNRPFYQSAQLMTLSPLHEEIYYDYASRFFEQKRGLLDKDVFKRMYRSFDGYTWFIQAVLNRLYEQEKKVEADAQVADAIMFHVNSMAPHYQTVFSFLTDNQRCLLRAIASMGIVKQPQSVEFIRNYNLPSSSSIKSALEVLVEKELVYQTLEGYIVYDRFFSIWLKRL